jgi:hypothetical protein
LRLSFGIVAVVYHLPDAGSQACSSPSSNMQMIFDYRLNGIFF